MLVSRALYRTRIFDLSGLPARDRQDALALQLTAWAPFDEAEYLVGLVGRHALAFACDTARVDGLLEGAGRPRGSERVLWPEDLLRPPLQDGIRLHACLEGFEAQAWQGGLPRESHWWPAFPDAEQWQAFLHGRVASSVANAALRDAETPWRVRPWLRVVPLHALNRQGGAWERLMWSGLAAAFAVAAGWRSHEWHQTRLVHEAASAELSALRADSAKGLAQREQVLRDQTRVEKLTQALQGVAFFEMLSRLSQALPKTGVQLREFRLEGAALRLSLAIAPEVPRSTVVQSLQSTGFFVDVRELREAGAGGSVAFEMSYRHQGAEGLEATWVPRGGAVPPAAAASGRSGPPIGVRP